MERIILLQPLKPLKRVSNERQTHISRVFFAQGFYLRTVLGRVVFLADLVDREVLYVDVGFEVRLEGRADGAKFVPFDAVEEGVGFDLLASVRA